MLQMFVGAKYKWMEKRRWAYLFSGILVLASIVSLVAARRAAEVGGFLGRHRALYRVQPVDPGERRSWRRR